MSATRHLIHTDVAVIGAGTAGLAAYRAAKAAGRNAVIIEAGPGGTTCASVGCMPSKLLIAPAEAAHSLGRFAEFGLAIQGRLEIDRQAVMQRLRRERDRFVGFVQAGVESIAIADRLHGHARFIDAQTLQVGEATRVRARSIVIATGSSPAYPAAWQSLGKRLLTNQELFELESLPQSVAVFGPGVIGLELGQALARLGVRVRVFGKGGSIGPIADPALREKAAQIFGAEFPLDPDADARVSSDGDTVRVSFCDGDGQWREESFDYLLAATGRRANLAGLDLQRAGIALDAQGRPSFDPLTMQIGSSSIFIAGDANDDRPLLHEAADEGRIAGSNAARFPEVTRQPRRAPLAIVFTDPQIAIVGGGYRQASRDTAPVIGVASFDDQGRSRVMLRHRGLLHVYAEPGSGRFIGAEMLGPDAEHIGHLLAWALQMNLTVEQMLAMPFYHPVVEEGLRTALRDAAAKLGEVRPRTPAHLAAA